MTNTIVAQRIELAEAVELLAKFGGWDYQQSPSYCSEAAGKKESVEALSIYEAGELIGLTVVRVRHLPLTPIRVAYVSGGPVCRPAQDMATFEKCVRALRTHYVTERGHVLRIAPPADSSEQALQQSQVLIALGFRKSNRRAYHTILKPINIAEDLLRASFHQKWRACLTQSEKSEQVISRGTSDLDFHAFGAILREMMEIKSFEPARPVSFFQAMHNSQYARDEIVLHLSWSQDELVAGHLAAVTGDRSTYLLGASTAKGRVLNAGYRLQWEFMKYAKAANVVLYDLGGVDEEENPSVFRFKDRMRGDHVVWAGYFDSCPSQFLDYALRLAEAFVDYRSERRKRLSGLHRPDLA